MTQRNDRKGINKDKSKGSDPAQPHPGKKPLHDKSSDEEFPQSPPADSDQPAPPRNPAERESDDDVIAPDGTPAPERKPEPLF